MQTFSNRTLSAFKQLVTGISCRDIDIAFTDEGFVQGWGYVSVDGSQRRALVEGYLSDIDWGDPSVVRRFLRVMETLLEPISPAHTPGSVAVLWARFAKWMRDDGWIVHDDGSIKSLLGIPVSLWQSMENIEDVSGIEEGIRRLKAYRGDPAASIGAAKELVESTAKVILQELNESGFEDLKFPQLISKVQKCLGLDPGSKALVDGEQSVKRILGGVSSVVLGLNELRNAGYGTGHGPKSARRGLGDRHGALAVNAAVLWCDLTLSTYCDPQAPWKKLD
ncbi:abortive infection family protein [Dermabacteraceae bacterium P7074]